MKRVLLTSLILLATMVSFSSCYWYGPHGGGGHRGHGGGHHGGGHGHHGGGYRR